MVHYGLMVGGFLVVMSLMSTWAQPHDVNDLSGTQATLNTTSQPTANQTLNQPPHIIFLVADDAGWNDFGWHNAEMITPNMDRLARDGVILDANYMQPLCTPSRSAFLSGYYPFHTGMQGHVLRSDSTRHLPENLVILPQYLKQAGYATHLVGKWHVGHCKWGLTPTRRGFDSYMGYYLGTLNYYNRTNPDSGVFDFRMNQHVYHDESGEYSPFFFARRAREIIESHDPSQPLFLYIAFQNPHTPITVPTVYEDMYSNVTDQQRRIYSGMMTALDDAIGNVTQALDDAGFFDNLLFVFSSDNGGGIGADNSPLRGRKGSTWEGGTRVPAFAYSKTLLSKTGYTNNEIIHAVDWVPTFMEVAGLKPNRSLDGVSQWATIREGAPSARFEFVYNINVDEGAIRFGDFKLVFARGAQLGTGYGVIDPSRGLFGGYGEGNGTQRGPPAAFQGYGGRNRTFSGPGNGPNRDGIQSTGDGATQDMTFELFNVITDPSETTNIADQNPEMLRRLKQRMVEWQSTEVPAQHDIAVQEADPLNYDNIVSPGFC